MTPEEQLNEARYVLNLVEAFLDDLETDHWSPAIDYRVDLALKRIGGDADAGRVTMERAVKEALDRESVERIAAIVDRRTLKDGE